MCFCPRSMNPLSLKAERFVVAEADGAVQGFGQLAPLAGGAEGGPMRRELRSLIVDPERRLFLLLIASSCCCLRLKRFGIGCVAGQWFCMWTSTHNRLRVPPQMRCSLLADLRLWTNRLDCLVVLVFQHRHKAR